MTGSSTVSSFTRSCIYQQGFTGLDDEQIRGLKIPLRFTPAVCMLLTIIRVGVAIVDFAVFACSYRMVSGSLSKGTYIRSFLQRCNPSVGEKCTAATQSGTTPVCLRAWRNLCRGGSDFVSHWPAMAGLSFGWFHGGRKSYSGDNSLVHCKLGL
jgi:hypothetical protein